MLKRAISIVLALTMFVCLAACATTGAKEETPPASTDAPAAPAAATEFPEMTVTFSTSALGNNFDGQGKQKFADYVADATGGKVKVKVYFGNSLYPQDQEVSSLMSGDLDMTGSNGGGLAEFIPALGMLDSGYIFKNYEHWKKFYDSETWKELQDKIANELGIRVLGEYTGGGRTVNLTTDKRVTKRADLKDVKIRMPNNESWLFLGESLGANPIPMAKADIYLGLQTGTIDGQDNPISVIKDASYYEVTKSVTVTGHVQSTRWYMINEDLWKSFSPELQQIFLDAAEMACNYCDETAHKNYESDVAFLKDKGLKVYELTDDELTTYSKEVLDYYMASDMVKNWDMDLYNAIQDLAK